MKHIIRLLTLAFMLGITLPDAQGQVSVRRGGSRTESSSSKKDNKKDNKKDDKKGADKSASAAAARTPEGMSPVVGRAADEQRAVRTGREAANAPAPVSKGDGATAPQRRTTPRRPAAATTVDGNTVRQQQFADYQRQQEGYTPWQHVIYRELDLTQESNASLYYPQEPQDGLTNLFRVILEGLCTGRIKGYEYLDGREVFDKKYEVNVQDVLDKFQILYQKRPGVGQGAQPTFIVDEMDVPCNEVLSYFIKERWEFNQKTSKYGPRILALCPVLHRAGDFGGDAVHYPMFWVNYEDLRPLLRDHLVMSDGMNNTPRFTMEEFFTLEQYKGDIYKVQNTRGLSLMQQYPNADTLKMMQAKIEAELRGFGKGIWIEEPDPATEQAAQDSLRAARRAERHARRGDSAPASNDASTKKNRRTKETVDLEAVEEAKEAEADAIDARVEQTGTAHSARRSARRR